jgi:hypothetical protein
MKPCGRAADRTGRYRRWERADGGGLEGCSRRRMPLWGPSSKADMWMREEHEFEQERRSAPVGARAPILGSPEPPDVAWLRDASARERHAAPF